MGIFGFIFGKKGTDWKLGALKNLDDITLDDMKINPIWANDVSGEWEDNFDESSERPLLGTNDITKAMLSEFVSISMLVEFPNENELGSANIEDDSSISCVAVWRNSEWLDVGKAFESESDIEIKAIPTINGKKGVVFVYDPSSDRGKKK